jgi:hypothetical protein
MQMHYTRYIVVSKLGRVFAFCHFDGERKILRNKIEMIILLGWMPPQADDTTCP